MTSIKIRILFFNFLSLLFLFVEKDILSTQKQLDFLEKFEPLLREELQKTLRLHRTHFELYSHKKKASSKYNEIAQRINVNYKQVQEVGFVNEQGKILNYIRNSPLLLERRHRLVSFIRNRNQANSDEFNSIFLGDKLYSFKPIHLFGEKSYFVVVWNFQTSSFALYTLILVGIFSVYMSISLRTSKKEKDTLAKVSKFTEEVDEAIKQTKEQSEAYLLQIERETEEKEKAEASKKAKVKETEGLKKSKTKKSKNNENDFLLKNDTKLKDSPEDQAYVRYTEYLRLDENLPMFFAQEIWGDFTDTEKKFILIDPVLAEYRETVKASTIITNKESDKLRAKAFDPETKDLIQKVIKETPASLKDSLEQLKNIQKMFDNLERSPQSSFLENIYFTKPATKQNLKELSECLKWITQSFHADSAIFLSYNSSLICYEPIVGFGMSNEAWKNFYVLEKDPLLPADTKNDSSSTMSVETVLSVNEEMKTAPDFRKRLSKEKASQIEWIYLLSLQFADINALIVFFYEKPHEKDQINDFKSDAANKLNEFLPILRRGVLKDASKKEEVYKQARLELERMITSDTPHIKIIHVRPHQPISVQSFNKQQSRMKELLKNSERLLYNSPKHLIAYLSSTDVKNFISKLIKAFGEIEYEVREYSDKTNVLDYYLL